jgi:hypothetical protein
MRTATSLGFYSRMEFMLQLLPLLRSSRHGRVVSIFGGGFENTKISLEDFDHEKPGAWGPISLQGQMSNMLSVCMDQLAEENPDVTFVHQHPGLVWTGSGTRALPKERWMMHWVMGFLLTLINPILGVPLKDSGERTLYLMTSAQYGGKGAPLGKDIPIGKPAIGTESGGLFTASRLNDVVVRPELWEKLRKDYRPAVWKNMMEKLTPYV